MYTTEQRIVLDALHVAAYLEWERGPQSHQDIHSITFQGLQPDELSDSTEGLTSQMVSDLLFDGLIDIDFTDYDDEGIPCRHVMTMTRYGHEYMNDLYVT